MISNVNFRNHILLEEPINGSLVEIHWRLFFISPVINSVIDELVRQNQEEIDFYGQKLNALNYDLQLLHLIIHGGMHAWFRLKWLEDIHQILLKNLFDPDKFAELTRKLRAQRMVNLCNYLIQYIYPDSPNLPGPGKASRLMLNFAKAKIHSESDRQFRSISELFQYSVYIFISVPGLFYKIRALKFFFNLYWEK